MTTMHAVREAVCKAADIPIRDFMDKSRFPCHVRPRHVFFWISKRYLGLSYPQIGRFSKRHHVTVMHGVKKIDGRPDLYEKEIAAVEKLLGMDRLRFKIII